MRQFCNKVELVFLIFVEERTGCLFLFVIIRILFNEYKDIFEGCVNI